MDRSCGSLERYHASNVKLNSLTPLASNILLSLFRLLGILAIPPCALYREKGVMMKGIIALDIDGTIAVDNHSIDKDVVSFLGRLTKEGWKLIFITGRTFAWGYQVLQYLDFPYHFAVQNGAIILEMPSRRIASKKYIDISVFPFMDEICKAEPSDFVIYTGYENNDICYYRPSHFAPFLLDYLKERREKLDETWVALDSFDDLPLKEFPSIKCFGHEDSTLRISHKIVERLKLHVPLIRDPYYMKYYVAQATHPEVSKGYALLDFARLFNVKTVKIAAGDDNNDRSMLAVADIKVVMATAPADMISAADVVAPPALEKGIIEGLKEAIRLVDKI